MTEIFPNIDDNTQLITVFDFQNCFKLAKNPITPDQLKQLINCPSSNTINDIIRKRNSLVKQINNIYKI